jgi:hypothetical protein
MCDEEALVLGVLSWLGYSAPTRKKRNQTRHESEIEIILEREVGRRQPQAERPTLPNAQDRFQLPFHM